jgi:hypothetical protein
MSFLKWWEAFVLVCYRMYCASQQQLKKAA